MGRRCIRIRRFTILRLAITPPVWRSHSEWESPWVPCGAAAGAMALVGVATTTSLSTTTTISTATAISRVATALKVVTAQMSAVATAHPISLRVAASGSIIPNTAAARLMPTVAPLIGLVERHAATLLEIGRQAHARKWEDRAETWPASALLAAAIAAAAIFLADREAAVLVAGVAASAEAARDPVRRGDPLASADLAAAAGGGNEEHDVENGISTSKRRPRTIAAYGNRYRF